MNETFPPVPLDKPQHVLDLEMLRDSGGRDKLDRWAEDETQIWIKTKEGWQKAVIVDTGYGALLCFLEWTDQGGKKKRNRVKSLELLRWQDEAEQEGLNG